MAANDYPWEQRYAEGFELCRKLGNQEALTFSRYQAFLEKLYTIYPERFKDRTIVIAGMGTGEGADGEALTKATLKHADAKEIKFIGVDIDRDYVNITEERVRQAGIANVITFQGDAFAIKTLEAVIAKGNGHLPTMWQYDHVVYFVDDKPGFVKNLNNTLMPDSFVLLAHGEGTAKKLKTAFETNHNPNYELGDFYVEVDFNKVLGEPMSQKHWDALQKAEALLSETHDPYLEYPGLIQIRKIIEFRNRGPLESLDETQRRNILTAFETIIEDHINGKTGCYKYRNQMQVMLQTDRDPTLETKILEAVNHTRTTFGLQAEQSWQPTNEVGNGINLSPHATIHLATENSNKARHARNFLEYYLVPLRTVRDNLPITGNFEFPAEKTIAQGGTCEKNSETKLLVYARTLRASLIDKWEREGLTTNQIQEKLNHQIVLADDSELVVEGLEWRRGTTPHPVAVEGKATHGREFPGSFTKPWVHEIASGTDVSHHEMAAAEISNLLGGRTEIPAYFRALYSIVSLGNLDRVHQVAGRLEGTFIYPPKQGEYGWGFESSFIPAGRNESLAQIPIAEKSQFNQVARALEGIVELFYKNEENVRITEFDLRGLTADSKASEIERIKHYIARYKAELGLEDAPIPFICGSAMVEDQRILNSARKMGERFGMVITGGGAKSVMGALADGARLPIGITCDIVENIEPVFSDIMQKAGRPYIMIRTDNIRERLALMRELSQIEICKPGGVGSIEEMFTGIIAGREILLEHPFYQPLQQFADKMHQYGYIDAEQRGRLSSIDENGLVLDCAVPVPDAKAAESFREYLPAIMKAVVASMQGRGYSNVTTMPTGKSVDELDPSTNLYLAGPGDFHTIAEIFELMVKKRMENGLAEKSGAPNPLKNQPLVVVNIDGFYDGVKEMGAGID